MVIPACFKRESIFNFQMIKTADSYYVYILASQNRGTLYIGVTQNLIKRIYEHRNNLIDGFTKQYNVHKLVYFEATSNPSAAVAREKRLKKWNRKWKIELIEKSNPQWKDLYENLSDGAMEFCGSPIKTFGDDRGIV